MRRDGQHLRRDDLAVIGQDKKVGRVAANVLDRALSPQAGRAEGRDMVLVRPRGNWRVDLFSAGSDTPRRRYDRNKVNLRARCERRNDGHGE